MEGFEFHRTDISVGNTDTFKKASGTLEVKATFEGHYIDVEAPALEVPALTANPLPATDEISEQPIVATQTPQMETEVENQNEAGRIEAGEKAPDSVSTQGENASKKAARHALARMRKKQGHLAQVPVRKRVMRHILVQVRKTAILLALVRVRKT